MKNVNSTVFDLNFFCERFWDFLSTSVLTCEQA
ncbi:hypothetical protein TFLX_02742 [Thermoflexales bacterium]|nr:hypothetical protein TFLX_02742 [Thermoflexales bacterium]